MENFFGFADREDFFSRRCIWVNGPVMVGAGPSGLATAACLREQGVPYVVLEKADCIASLWQKRTYDRLKLHLPKQFCQLPKLPLPQEFPEYPTRIQFIEYLEAESNFERHIVETRGQIAEHLYGKNGFLYLCTNPRLSQIESARVHLLLIEKRLCHTGSVESRGRGGEGSGFGSECRDVKGEGSGSVESECRDAEEGEGNRSGGNQDRDGEGEGSSSGESQGQDRGEGSASGENQGGDRNAEGSGSNDDEDERERQRRVGGDIEQGIQENNQEEIDFSGIPEAFLGIIGATSIAAVGFHSSGAISFTILNLVMAINVFGFLCCMTSMLQRRRRPMVARIFGTIGAAAAGFGLLLLVSVYFSSYYGWMILGLGSLAILVICVWAFLP